MKKSSFMALVFGMASLTMFALGMCMCLLTEWNAFKEGVFFGIAGLIMGAATWVAWCRMEKKKLPEVNGKSLLRVGYGVLSVLILGVGMCMCLVGQNYVWGTVVGLAGMLMLLGLIPMVKGLR